MHVFVSLHGPVGSYPPTFGTGVVRTHRSFVPSAVLFATNFAVMLVSRSWYCAAVRRSAS